MKRCDVGMWECGEPTELDQLGNFAIFIVLDLSMYTICARIRASHFLSYR